MPVPALLTGWLKRPLRADLAQWVFHASREPNLRERFHSDEARCAKVAFDRVRCYRVCSPSLGSTGVQSLSNPPTSPLSR